MFWSAIPRAGPGASIRTIHQMSHFFCDAMLSGSFRASSHPHYPGISLFFAARITNQIHRRRIPRACEVCGRGCDQEDCYQLLHHLKLPSCFITGGEILEAKNHQKSPTNGGFSSHVALPKGIPNEIITHQRGVYWQRG